MREQFERCQNLWAAALTQKIKDALHERPSKYGYSSGASDLEHHQAKRWFGSPDYQFTCYCAGFDPDWLLPKIPINGTREEKREFLIRLRGDIRVGRRSPQEGEQSLKGVRIGGDGLQSPEPASGALMRYPGSMPEPAL